jgi:hypothetical protein
MKNLLLILGTLLIATPFVLLCLYAVGTLTPVSESLLLLLCFYSLAQGIGFLGDSQKWY